MLATIGAIAALLADCKIEVIIDASASARGRNERVLGQFELFASLRFAAFLVGYKFATSYVLLFSLDS